MQHEQDTAGGTAPSHLAMLCPNGTIQSQRYSSFGATALWGSNVSGATAASGKHDSLGSSAAMAEAIAINGEINLRNFWKKYLRSK